MPAPAALPRAKRWCQRVRQQEGYSTGSIAAPLPVYPEMTEMERHLLSAKNGRERLRVQRHASVWHDKSRRQPRPFALSPHGVRKRRLMWREAAAEPTCALYVM